MAKHITENEVKVVLQIIDEWSQDEKLTWDALCNTYETVFEQKTTRQRLERHNRLKLAYKDKKEAFKNHVTPTVSVPPSLKIAQERINRLNSQVERLSRENQALLEQFKVWQYNAYCSGMKEHELNRPLPPIDRESNS
jgi:hypothetical protein